MTDLNSQFFAILTKVGEAKQANADALGIPWNISQMGVGDAHGTDPIPDRLQTKLINERRRAPLNQLMIDPLNPSVLIAEQVIPADVGGWWVREIGLYDADGDLVAVANCAPSFKPLLSQGSGRTQIVRMNFIISSLTNVVLKIDPAIVLATREYVDRSIDVVLPANKIAGTYTQVAIDKRGIVVSGTNPTTLDGYGITDALRVGTPSDQRPSLFADRTGGDTGNGIGGALEIREAQLKEGASQAFEYAPRIMFHWKTVAARALAMGAGGGLFWGGQQVFTAADFNPANKADKAITLAGYGIQDAYTKVETNTLLGGKAPLASPTFTGTVNVPTPAVGSNNKQAANTEYVAAAVAALVDAAPGALDTLAELAKALGNDPNFAATITNELAKKLKPGDYGVGGNAVDFPDNNLSNSVAPSGLYRTSTGALNAPPGVNVQGSLVRQEVWNNGVVQQWFGEHITGRLWRRACNAGAWSPWAEVVIGIEGAIMAFAMSTPPPGWIICNGYALSRTTYAALFAKIGTTYGAGDGATTFNIPDARGKFVRAADLNSGIDPGRVLGTDQMDGFPDHGHVNTLHTANGPPGGGGEFVGSGGAPGSIQVSGRVLGAVPLAGGSIRTANETRPRNLAFLVCIKY